MADPFAGSDLDLCDQVDDLNNGASSDLELAVSEFSRLRPRLFRIAYRLRGNTGEAEDIVQEAWIRWQTCDRSSVRNARAFLCSVTQRLSINAGNSAHARHETCMGRLPERVDAGAVPGLAAEQAEAVQMAVWVILEKLSPTERAAFLLREAFDYPYEHIAEVIHETNVSVRQQVSRARKHVVDERRSVVSAAEHQRLTKAFIVSARTGDMTGLEDILVRGVRCLKSRPATQDTIRASRR